MNHGSCRRLLPAAAVSLLCAGLTWTASRAEPNVPGGNSVDKDHAAKMARGLELFKKHVRPVLVERCLKCHGGESTESKFDLTDRPALLRGGKAGPAVVAGNSKSSLLYKLVAHARKPHMPYDEDKLPAEAIVHMAAWIDNGAPYDRSLIEKKETPSWTNRVVAETDRRFWSFQPLRRVEPPAVKNAAWCQTLLDRFILAKLEAASLPPNPPVNKRQLIRRAYFDLLGLPPTPAEIEAFVNDPAPAAYERLLDRLLTSPHYGERWGRYWLDLARFAESHGFEHDYDRPSAYHYRDFVIQALNQDLPYHTFVRWQLAGDEFAPDNNLALMATGFLAAGVHSTQITKNEVEKHRYDEMDDMAATVGTSMLGLTFGCARCHDHKFDPIPQADYYRMVATFTTTVRSEVDLNVDPAGYQKTRAIFDAAHAPYLAALQRFETEQLPARRAQLEQAWSARPDRDHGLMLDGLSRGGIKLAALIRWSHTTDPEWRQLKQREQEHLRQAPKPQLVKALIASEGLPAVRLHSQGGDFFNETYFLRRGDPDQKVGVAQQGFLQVLTPAPDREKHWQVAPPPGWRTSYRRRALADWLTDVDQGAGHLLARVIVNRLWQRHLGRGIVATPSDFGHRGEPPTHPELLDWLATELIQNGWHLKPIHKLIMSSSVYMQSSQLDEARVRRDSDNRLFWRRPRHRLEAEVIRDSLLMVSGQLDPKMFGPGTLDEASKRRSIYFTVKRSKLVPMMQVFDGPDALSGIADRPTTTIAPQALMLMNNPNVRSYAKSFARRIAPDAKTSVEDAVKAGYLMALTREPNAEEFADAIAFVKGQVDSYRADGKDDGRELALADFSQVLMCLNEFVYID